MIYKFWCRGEIIRVFIWNDKYHSYVSVCGENKNYDRSIRQDAWGKFFTWNNTKVYLDDWIKISMKELKDKIDNHEDITTHDLCQSILTDGVENVRFMVPLHKMTLSSLFIFKKNYVYVECKIEEVFGKEVINNCTIRLVPVKPSKMITKYEDHDTSDLLADIISGKIKIVI